MFSVVLVIFGLVIAIAILSTIPKVPSTALRVAVGLAALVVLFIFVLASSLRYVPEDKVGIVIKNIGLKELPPGTIIATQGEMGPQAEVLGPGWHQWYWPFVFDIELIAVTTIPEEQVGLITAQDGAPLPQGEIYAPEWEPTEVSDMLKAEHFLTTGNGYKGPQATVLTPGKYRLNTKLYEVTMSEVTNIEKATVGVVKSNVGQLPVGAETDTRLVNRGERGIWREPYTEQKLYLNPKAYEITMISTKRNVVRYTASQARGEQEEIEVRSSDGFTFPVDVRIEYQIKPEDASVVVKSFGDDKEKLSEVLTSAVRAIFRNNAERVKALDYVQQRSIQESQSLEMLEAEMAKVGVTVTAVRIGDVGDEASLGTLLKTQTDREIALQEVLTFQQQQLAFEEEKKKSRTQQEVEEERRLATAQYQVKIAEEDKQRRIIEAGAEAEAISIKAKAQADAYQMIAEQIGKGNAALVELLKIVGESGINITPRVMVVGGNGSGAEADKDQAEMAALIGTMLDTMVRRADEEDTMNQGSSGSSGSNN